MLNAFDHWLFSLSNAVGCRLRYSHLQRRRAAQLGVSVPSEVLEQRAVMTANVIASLSDGVLTVEGTDRNDRIIVQQVDGQLSIQGVRINVDGKLVDSVSASDVQGIEINGQKGNDLIQFRESGGRREAIQIDATVDGGVGNDTIEAGSGNDFLSGGDGNDLLRGGRGDDVMYGDAGNDSLFGGDGNDLLYGDSYDGHDFSVDSPFVHDFDYMLPWLSQGNDWLSGDADDDVLYGTGGNDVLRGGTGNDTLSGGLGNDQLDGGTGTDRGQEVADVNFRLTRNQLTGLGTDRLSNIEQAELRGGAGNNRIDASKFDGQVTLEGGEGNDTLLGGSGSDLLFGGCEGISVLGIDSAFYFLGDRLEHWGQTDNGNDSLNGGAGADWLDGGNGADQLNGGTGNDTLTAQDGHDTMTGGTGIDQFFIHESDRLTDLSDEDYSRILTAFELLDPVSLDDGTPHVSVSFRLIADDVSGLDVDEAIHRIETEGLQAKHVIPEQTEDTGVGGVFVDGVHFESLRLLFAIEYIQISNKDGGDVGSLSVVNGKVDGVRFYNFLLADSDIRSV